MEERNIRSMNELGFIQIPGHIQNIINIRAESTPEFEIKVENIPKEHIALYPLHPVSDSMEFLEENNDTD